MMMNWQIFSNEKYFFPFMLCILIIPVWMLLWILTYILYFLAKFWLYSIHTSSTLTSSTSSTFCYSIFFDIDEYFYMPKVEKKNERKTLLKISIWYQQQRSNNDRLTGWLRKRFFFFFIVYCTNEFCIRTELFCLYLYLFVCLLFFRFVCFKYIFFFFLHVQ